MYVLETTRSLSLALRVPPGIMMWNSIGELPHGIISQTYIMDLHSRLLLWTHNSEICYAIILRNEIPLLYYGHTYIYSTELYYGTIL